MADYQINLIEPAAMEEEDLAKLQSDLRSVLGFIKYADDKEALKNFLSNDASLKRLDTEAAQVISACTNIKMEIKKEEEVVDVCKAVEQMTEEARREGRLETLRNDVKNVMKSLNMSMEEALKVLNINGEDRTLLVKML